MQAFARLLDSLSFQPARNAKLRLIETYLRETPDPDRGWALAALTGGLDHFDIEAPTLRALRRRGYPASAIRKGAGESAMLSPFAARLRQRRGPRQARNGGCGRLAAKYPYAAGGLSAAAWAGTQLLDHCRIVERGSRVVDRTRPNDHGEARIASRLRPQQFDERRYPDLVLDPEKLAAYRRIGASDSLVHALKGGTETVVRETKGMKPPCIALQVEFFSDPDCAIRRPAPRRWRC